MPNRTLYVKEEDVPVWDKAVEVAGRSSLSNIVTAALRQFVEKAEASASKMERLEVFLWTDEDDSDVETRAAFWGRWLVEPTESFETPGVALTRKGSYVLYDDMEGKIEPFKSLDELKNHLDRRTYRRVRAQVGDVEELDI